MPKGRDGERRPAVRVHALHGLSFTVGFKIDEKSVSRKHITILVSAVKKGEGVGCSSLPNLGCTHLTAVVASTY